MIVNCTKSVSVLAKQLHTQKFVQPDLEFKHAHGDLEDDSGAVVKEKVPEA